MSVEITCGNRVGRGDLDDPLLPSGPAAERMLIEHRTGGHPTNPIRLDYAGTCPLCYKEGLNGQ